MLLSNQNKCDNLKIEKIPNNVLKGLAKHLNLDVINIVSSFDKPRLEITSDDNFEKIVCRAWYSEKYDILLCHRCSGYYGWFIWIGQKRFLWLEEKNKFIKPSKIEGKLIYI